MNTWIFSKNGQVSEPLELAAAKKYVVENQDAYAWQSSYNQWLPVHSISEFSALLPPRQEVAKLPQNIVDEFNRKEQALEKRFGKFNQELARGEETAKLFEQEIANYKRLTINLSDEVKGNINEIEQQYNALHKQLADIKQTVHASQQGLGLVVVEFNKKVSGKSIVKMDSAAQAPENKQAAVEVKKVAEPLQASVAETAQVEEKAEKPVAKAISTRARRPTGAHVVSTRTGQPYSADTATDAKAPEAQVESSKVTPINKVTAKATNSAEDEAQEKVDSGVKNIFKSVFTKEESTSSTNKFAELVEDDVEEDDMNKKVRKRRRR
ncbi:MAG: hypothetical protein ACPG52_06830 [Cognaticolwellia sp.]